MKHAGEVETPYEAELWDELRRATGRPVLGKHGVEPEQRVHPVFEYLLSPFTGGVK